MKHSIIRWWGTLPSTNTAMKEAVLRGEPLPDGTAFATKRQTAGRGRLGRSWNAPDGQTLALSLWMTGTPCPPTTAVAGIAVTRVLCTLTDSAFELKWPNDSICGDRKVGGLLCEGVMLGETVGTVVGIGLNLLQSAEFFEEAGLPYGGSVKQLTGRSLSPETVAEAIVSEWSACVARFRAEGFSPFREEYERLCRTVGKTVQVLSPDGQVTAVGKAMGVDDEGALLIRTEKGTVERCRAGEVSVRGLYGYV